jgi:hypothetical protein
LKAQVEKKQKPQLQQQPALSWLLYLLLALLIVVYALVGNPIVGLAALLLILIILIFEVKTSVSQEGTRKSIMDIASAVGAAVVVWVLLILFLHTTAPVNAVSSCSMLPVLHRGDLVVLHGIGNITAFVESEHVPLINVTQAQFAQMQGSMNSEFLAYFAYFNGNESRISYVLPNSSSDYQIGLYNTLCVSDKQYLGKPNQLSQCLVPAQYQQTNLIKYSYSLGTLSLSGQAFNAIYTSQITVGNTTLQENFSDPIIVYQTTSKDTFSGSVIHRLYAVINAGGAYYFLTKGDNNQGLDIEFGNYPANQSAVLGYVIADIPVLGYVKLLLSGQITTPAGCNTTLSTH